MVTHWCFRIRGFTFRRHLNFVAILPALHITACFCYHFIYASLWPVVFIQGAITAGILYLVIRTVFDQGVSAKHLLAVTCLLTLFSSLPWHTGQILPDIFSSILILAIYVVVFGWINLNYLSRAFIVFVLFIATAFHYSHLPLLAVTGGMALLLAAWNNKSMRGLWIPVSLILATGITVAAAFATYNYAYSGRASISLDSSKFLLARLIGDGTAVAFLKQTCPDSRFVLCDHLDEINGDHNTFCGMRNRLGVMWKMRVGFSEHATKQQQS